MRSFIRNKTFGRRLILLSSGLLLATQSVIAAEPSDAQAQARALLNPPVASHVISAETRTSTQANDRSATRPDAQAMARALLLGQSNESGAAQTAIVRDSKAEGAPSHSTQDRRAYSDPQEAARRMILGIGAPVVAATKFTVSER